MYYLLIGISTVMFGLQFFFQKLYQENEGEKLYASILFSLGTAVSSAVAMFAIGRCFEFSLFSCGIALLGALLGIVYLIFSARAFEKVNLSVYSLFSMLGGMLLPALFGILCYGEPFSVRKGLCMLLIVLALIVGSGEKAEKKGLGYCLVIFVLNGLAGVLSKWHQSGADAISGTGYMLLKSLWNILLAAALLLLLRKKRKPLAKPLPAVGAMTAYGLMTGLANLFVLIALLHVNASVQYPMITGGTIVVSTLLGKLRGEKITTKNLLAAVVSLGATLLIME